MLRAMDRRLLTLFVALGAAQPACSLLESDFEGSVTLNFVVDDPDNIYQSIDMFDPNDNDDFRENRDRIETGTIESMELTFRNVRFSPENEATYVFGQADIRPAGDESAPWTEGVSAWETIAVVENNTFFVDVPADRQEVITDLVFEADESQPLEVRIDGAADQGPVLFDIEVRLNLVFTAGVL